ncbi:AAA family ATPase [Brachybacterium paraconglomeratum]
MITLLNSIDLSREYRALDLSSINGLAFRKYNLIFGRNGSGKTSFTEVLRELRSDSSLGHLDLDHSTDLRIEVFNRYVVEESLKDFSSGTGVAQSIALGKKNIDLKDEQDSLQALLESREETLESVKRLRSQIDPETKISGRAKERVLEHLDGTAPGFNRSQYRNDARLREKILGTSPAGDDVTITSLKQAIPGEGLRHTSLTLPKIADLTSELPSQLEIDEVTNYLPGDTTEELEEASKRLIDWLRDGLDLHPQLKSATDCLFCGNSLTGDRRELLINTLDSKPTKVISEGARLASQIRTQVVRVKTLLEELSATELGDDSHQSKLKAEIAIFAQTVQKFESEWSAVATSLESKIENISSSIPSISAPKNVEYPAELTKTLDDYRNLVDAQDSLRRTAIARLEEHILHEFKEKLVNARREIEVADRCIRRIEASNRRIASEIQGIVHRLSDTAEMAEHLTADLGSYGGLSALKVVPTADGKFYEVRRANGERAEHLSDGERNLLTFFYFLRTLEDISLEGRHLLVVIDDPMTSLDSENIHVLTQTIAHRWRDWHQVVVSTHNHSFFYELLANVPDSASASGDLQVLETYGASTSDPQSPTWGLRPANTLKTALSSEYHYAFWCTAQAAVGLVDDLYLSSLGNAARRLLEGFASFKRPATNELRQSLESAWAANKSLAKMTPALQSALSFANAHSHSRERVPREKPWNAAVPKDFAIILYVIYALDSDHFDQMLRTFPDDDNLHHKIRGAIKPFKDAYVRAQKGVDTKLDSALEN